MALRVLPSALIDSGMWRSPLSASVAMPEFVVDGAIAWRLRGDNNLTGLTD